MEKISAMREILFRGKRVDNGEWVEGYYGIKGEKTDIEIHCIMVSNLYKMSSIPHFYFEDIDVIPETVGQFTGLLNKNGTKIFEGDLINTIDRGLGLVKYTKGNFLVDYIKPKKHSFDYLGVVTSYLKYDLIGNIHDNPELL